MGHARALVSAGEDEVQIALFEKIITDNLSVREVEQLIKIGQPQIEKVTVTTVSSTAAISISTEQIVFKEFLSDRLATKVEINKSNAGSGKITMNFSSENDLNRIIELMTKK
jgi:ParB family chromosome partitioning protein